MESGDKIKSNIISDRSFVQVQVHSASRAFVRTYEPLDPSQYTIPRLSRKLNSCRKYPRYCKTCIFKGLSCLSYKHSVPALQQGDQV